MRHSAARKGRHSITWMISAVVGGCYFTASTANGNCLGLLAGPVVVEINGCKDLEPEKAFDTHKPKFSWITGLDATGKKQLYNSYRGLFVKAKVLKSSAVAQGLNTETAGLSGQTTFMFVPPPTALTCSTTNFKRLTASLKQVCCDGGGNAPCLLDTPYLLTQAQPAKADGFSEAKVKAKKSAVYGKAQTEYNEHKYKLAAKDFEKARINGELDIPGYYLLGDCYRKMDQCRDAIPVLKYAHDQLQAGQVWADEEEAARNAELLLAKCYSKQGNAEAATLILNGYLTEPAKYRRELNEALNHRDFGWIQTSQEYVDFAKAARQRLREVGDKPN